MSLASRLILPLSPANVVTIVGQLLADETVQRAAHRTTCIGREQLPLGILNLGTSIGVVPTA